MNILKEYILEDVQSSWWPYNYYSDHVVIYYKESVPVYNIIPVKMLHIL